MPTDKLIEQRIREKNESMHSNNQSEENERSTHKLSHYSHHKKSHQGGSTSIGSSVKMRKDDLKLYHQFLEMLKQYNYDDAQTILENLSSQLREECEDEIDQGDDQGGMDGEEEQIEQSDG